MYRHNHIDRNDYHFLKDFTQIEEAELPNQKR